MDPADGERPGEAPAEYYPSAFETDVVLTDGATAHVRPIRPDDGALLTAFHARQSPQSIYYRYFSPRPRLSEQDVERLTHVDYVDRFALVVLLAGELIGVARYDRWRHRSEAEVAFFVDDALVLTTTAPSHTANGFSFGDGVSASGNNGDASWDFVRVSQVPEPSTGILLAIGLLWLGRRQRSH